MHALQLIESELLRLKWQLAALRFERAMRRHALALKAYNPEQPRDELGRWTDGGGSRGSASRSTSIQNRADQEIVKVAGESSPPPLKALHPPSTYESDQRAKGSFEYWKRQPTNDIVNSLKPGTNESLKAYPDGRIANGNTRTRILQDRGYDINSLPREIVRPGPQGGGPLGGSGNPLKRTWTWQ